MIKVKANKQHLGQNTDEPVQLEERERFLFGNIWIIKFRVPSLRGNDFTVTHTYLHSRTPLPDTKSSLSLSPQRA